MAHTSLRRSHTGHFVLKVFATSQDKQQSHCLAQALQSYKMLSTLPNAFLSASKPSTVRVPSCSAFASMQKPQAPAPLQSPKISYEKVLVLLQGLKAASLLMFGTVTVV